MRCIEGHDLQRNDVPVMSQSMTQRVLRLETKCYWKHREFSENFQHLAQDHIQKKEYYNQNPKRDFIRKSE
jgi:hypothetical protein